MVQSKKFLIMERATYSGAKYQGCAFHTIFLFRGCSKRIGTFDVLGFGDRFDSDIQRYGSVIHVNDQDFRGGEWIFATDKTTDVGFLFVCFVYGHKVDEINVILREGANFIGTDAMMCFLGLG